MNKSYIIKKLFKRDGMKHHHYLAHRTDVELYWSPLKTNVKIFTLDEGNERISSIMNTDSEDKTKYALVEFVIESNDIDMVVEKTAVEPKIHTLIDPNNLDLDLFEQVDDNITAFDRAMEGVK